SRRECLTTSCGMAAAFVAMNAVYGRLFEVDAAEAADPGAAAARRDALRHQFVVDDQVHFVSPACKNEALVQLGEFAKTWNPALKDVRITLQRYQFETFVKEVFLDSDTTVALLSGSPFDNPENWLLSNDEMARTRAVINHLAGSRRLLCHAVIIPGQKGWKDEVDRAIAELKP